jgi:hypothetical protein
LKGTGIPFTAGIRGTVRPDTQTASPSIIKAGL